MTPGNKLVEEPKLLSHVGNIGSWERIVTSRSGNEPHLETHVKVTRSWKQSLSSCWGLLLPWRQELSLVAAFKLQELINTCSSPLVLPVPMKPVKIQHPRN